MVLTDSAEGQIVRVTVDSMTLVPSGEMQRSLPISAAGPVGDSTRGAYVRGFAVRGAVRGAPQASTPSPALASVIQAMNVLFPGLRSNIKVGDAWSDTSVVNTDGANGHQSGNIVANWKVSGTEGNAFILDGTAVTTMTTTAKNGQVLHVVGTSKEHLVMPSGGPSRNASIETSNIITSTIPQVPGPIPARSSGTLTLTRLP